MSRFIIISPMHIGSGQTYENFLLYQNKRYDFDSLISKVFKERKDQLLDPYFLNSLKSISSRSSQTAKQQIRRVILPKPEKIQELTPMYPVLPKLEEAKLNEKSINEFIKTINRPYIPGSTLKGYVMNVIFNDIIENDAVVNNFIKQRITEIEKQLIEKKRSKPYSNFYWNRMPVYRYYEKIERDALIIAAQSLICRDVIAPENTPLSIYFLNRQTKTSAIPQVAECLEGELTTADDAIIVTPFKTINRSNQDMVRIIAEAIMSRLKTLKEKFPSMNAAFLRRTLDFQKRFIEHLPDDGKISKDDIIEQLKNIEARLDRGQIVMQLGRYTNFVTKSASLALGHDFYEAHFDNVFTPGRKSKLFRIGTMNLLAHPNHADDFYRIPGYVVFEW